MAKYKCPSLGDCDKANAGEVFERVPGDDPKCPACQALLMPQMTPSPPAGSKAKVLIAAGAAVLALSTVGGYFYTKSAPIADESASIAAAPNLAVAVPELVSAAVPVAANAASGPAAKPGIAPPDAETILLRMQGDVQLARGGTAEAELASSKAIANEMLKVSIAKMSQGKFDEAEKDLNEARARAPKQPLVYYNMAILRLKQGRIEDALKEFEASFIAGFSYFDQMDQDSDLDGLRKMPRFVELVAKYRTLAK
jgi:tetratricopeptide (TPR) repeat protein